MRPQRRRRRRGGEVNIVPLVDVLIVLIFFFILTMRFPQTPTLNITPPPIETAGRNQTSELIRIAVDNEGNFYYNEAEVTREELIAAIGTAAGVDASQPVLVIADEESAVKELAFIMDQCRKAGLERIRLQAR